MEGSLDRPQGSELCRACTSLGIGYVLPRTPAGFVRVKNTDARKLEVASTCLRALQTATLSPSESECVAFAGRLRWLDSQIFGRQGRWAFRVILEAWYQTKP